LLIIICGDLLQLLVIEACEVIIVGRRGSALHNNTLLYVEKIMIFPNSYPGCGTAFHFFSILYEKNLNGLGK